MDARRAVQRRPVSMMPALRRELIARETDSGLAPVIPAKSARESGNWISSPCRLGVPNLSARRSRVAATRLATGAA